eukprot:TRINITY_DN6066_c0_g1_i8.p1 TRINITY_DN6066_c0_g1~~TRINITY_DN6066_c0_g1_i8.p1  ORF type:complete len:221 (-),score=10.73 TRINITY_DN6066_c0_g1_i8:161-823(-)
MGAIVSFFKKNNTQIPTNVEFTVVAGPEPKVSEKQVFVTEDNEVMECFIEKELAYCNTLKRTATLDVTCKKLEDTRMPIATKYKLAKMNEQTRLQEREEMGGEIRKEVRELRKEPQETNHGPPIPCFLQSPPRTSFNVNRFHGQVDRSSEVLDALSRGVPHRYDEKYLLSEFSHTSDSSLTSTPSMSRLRGEGVCSSARPWAKNCTVHSPFRRGALRVPP